MPKLSVVIVARNEEKNISGCLKSVSFADEIIVIDDCSEDNTVSIARDLGAKVFLRAMDGNYAAQKQFGMEQASGDWLLFLDCDERITPELANEIQQKVQENQKKTYLIRRLNYFNNTRVRYGTLRSDYVARLMPKDKIQIVGLVHERFEYPYEEQKCQHGMEHRAYASWSQYYRKFDQYTDLSAKQYLQAGKSVSFWRDIVFRPIWAFLKMYIIHGGFLDGNIGWILAVNHYHYTMTKYVRFYDLKNPF